MLERKPRIAFAVRTIGELGAQIGTYAGAAITVDSWLKVMPKLGNTEPEYLIPDTVRALAGVAIVTGMDVIKRRIWKRQWQDEQAKAQILGENSSLNLTSGS